MKYLYYMKKTFIEEQQRFFQIMSIIDESFKEEHIKLLNEINYNRDEDIDYSQFERENELKMEIFNDFLYHNTPNFTKHAPWTVIPFLRLKKIWEDFMTYGSVRDTRGIEMIEEIMINNTSKVSIFTNLAGHTQWGDEEAFDENIGYWVDEQLNCVYDKPFDKNQLEIPFKNPKKGYQEPEDNSPCQTTVHPFVKTFIDDKYDELPNREQLRETLYEEMTGRFFDYYMNDPEGKMGGFISDYGLKPLEELLVQLLRASTPEEKLLIIDRMLNVVHQRSDIAEWFVEGGSDALSQLSGNPSEALNEHSDIFISKSHIMKKTLQEEKDRILDISRKVTIIEGNAFSGAAAKAKDEGKDTFEFNGKTYNVTGTVKKETEEAEETEEKEIGATNMAIGFGNKK